MPLTAANHQAMINTHRVWRSLTLWSVAAAMVACSAPASVRASSGAAHIVPPAKTGEPPAPTNPTTTSNSSNSSLMSEQQQRQLQIFALIVLNPSPDITSETRRNAAQELIALNDAEAMAVLDEALRSQKIPLMLAAVSAMQSSATPVDELMAPALAALPGAPPAIIESLSWVIARYGAEALPHVARLATDNEQTVANRLGPIQALSAFDSQAAAAALMSLVNDPDEPVEITVAACEGLQRLSGLSHGTEAGPWRQWWKEAGALRAEEWSAYINKSLSKRAAQLQQDLQKQRETNELVSRELQAAYRELYPALATDEQLRRLPALLQNQFAAVREFAVNRVTVLLRDSVRIPLEVQQKLADRLADESATVRMLAAKSLDELNYDNTGPAIAARLGAEQSPQVIATYLEILARRPCPAALEPARRWLGDPEWSDEAAAIIWRLHESTPLSNDKLAVVRDEVRQWFGQRKSSALARLLAWIGDENDLPQLTDLLDENDPDLRAAISDGYCQRRLRQPLIDRAADPIIFPFAVRAMADGPADLAAFGLLAGWTPVENQRLAWSDGVLKMAGNLSNSQLLAADDILAAAPNADRSLREAVLVRAASLPAEELANGQRAVVIARLAPILLEQGEPARAHALLENANCRAPELRGVCFEAAALSGHYEKALQLESEPSAWVELLSRAAQHSAESVASLCIEIQRRFAGRLTPSDQIIVDEISEALRHAEATASTK